MSSALRNAVSAHITSTHNQDGLFPTVIDGLAVMKASGNVLPNHMIYRPALCIVVQGSKQVTFGDRTLELGEMQAMVVSLELPAFGVITKATPQRPYLALALELDIAVIQDVLVELDPQPRPNTEAGLSIFVQDVDGPLADCVHRLIRLLDTPKAIPVLSPAIKREICFWLLSGPNAAEVCKLAVADSHTRRIAAAIHILRDNFVRPIRVEELADAARMSPSSFHQHFKTLTSMTPLQYQKQLRLIEARRLLMNDGSHVAGAAHRVGYESPSQFSREYARMFGAPPKRDAIATKGESRRLSI